MANNSNNKFNIPAFAIIIAFLAHPPIAIALLVLKAIGGKSGQENKSSQNYSSDESYGTQSVKTEKKKAKKKKANAYSGAYKVLNVLTIVFAVITIFGLIGSVGDGDTLIDIISTLLPLTVVTGGLFTARTLVRNRDIRFARIRAMIGSKRSYNLVRLASAAKMSVKNVKKDVQKLIDSGEYGDKAYIDLGTNNFMKTPDAAPDMLDETDYKNFYGSLWKEEMKKSESSAVKSEDTQSAKEEEDVGLEGKADFSKIIAEIKRLNDEIDDPVVSEKIYRIEEHTTNIFDYVTDNPESMPQIRMFMNYYLPTTLKLLESYSRIERVGVAGENMRKSKENIESILDTLTVGFEQQVDQLFKNEFIDISSDISVLEKMMHKDGFGREKSEFEQIMEDEKKNFDDTNSAGGAAVM